VSLLQHVRSESWFLYKDPCLTTSGEVTDTIFGPMCWEKLGQVFNVQNNGHVWTYVHSLQIFKCRSSFDFCGAQSPPHPYHMYTSLIFISSHVVVTKGPLNAEHYAFISMFLSYFLFSKVPNVKMGKEKYSVIFVLSKTDDVIGQVSKIHPRTFQEDVEWE
jgi:hypothetical protein